jgi:sensor histidine kinase YesM
MSRRAVWLQLLIGWLPIWALFTVLIVFAHEGTTFHEAIFIALRSIIGAVILGFGVQRFTEWRPWPNPVRVSFVLIHTAAAIVYAFSWFVLNSIIQSILHGALVIVLGIGLTPFMISGIWLYIMIAGVSYTLQSNARAARAETAAAQAQLSALRGQINPHFLFNALHTVVQLIPQDPKNAAHAAELVAGLLRTTLEENRDIITVASEIDFVKRYLDVEKIRYGDRLQIIMDVRETAQGLTLPSFAIQTLVENAVRHGAQPNVDPTQISITAVQDGDVLRVGVTDTGVGYNPGDSNGTGLGRLRERLKVLYRGHAQLDVAPAASRRGTAATLLIPQEERE